MKSRIILSLFIPLFISACSVNRSAFTASDGLVHTRKEQAYSRGSLPCPPGEHRVAQKAPYRKLRRPVQPAGTLAFGKSKESKIRLSDRQPIPRHGSLPFEEDLLIVKENTYPYDFSAGFTGKVNVIPGAPHGNPVDPVTAALISEENMKDQAVIKYVPVPYFQEQSQTVPFAPVSDPIAQTEQYSAAGMAGNGTFGIRVNDNRQARALLITLAAGLAGLFLFGLNTIRGRRGMRLSTWAARHRFSSRAIVVAANMVMGFGGFLIGTWLNRLGLDLPGYLKAGSIGLLGLTALSYPAARKLKGSLIRSFRARKMHDLLMVIGASVLYVTVGNIHAPESWVNQQPSGLTGTTYISPLEIENSKAESGVQLIPGDWMLDRLDMQKSPGPRKLSTTAIVLLTLLSIAVFLVSAYALLGLACGLACGGYEIAAWLVLFGGGGGLITMLVVALKAIFKKKPEAVPELS